MTRTNQAIQTLGAMRDEYIRAEERERCIEAIRNWPELTEDEKHIAIMAIHRAGYNN